MAKGGSSDCDPLPEGAEALLRADQKLREAEEPNAPFVDCHGCEDTHVFQLDGDEGREFLGLTGPNKKICDGAILLLRPRPKLVFVELKSKDIQSADLQLKSAVQAFKKSAAGRACAADQEALVILSGSTPKGFNTKQKAFRKQTRCKLSILPGRKAATSKKKHGPNSRQVRCSELLDLP